MVKIIDLRFQGQPETIAAFLVETPEGPVLVETGPHSTFSALEQGINESGHAVKDIRHVFLTHIHLDHGGAAWCFAEHGAKIYLHPIGSRHFENPEKLLQSAQMIYQEKMDALWGQLRPIPKAQLVRVGHGERVSLGKMRFRAWHTPGHAAHHIAWQLDNALFAGDVAGVRIGKGIVVPPCPPPDINLEHWQKSIRLMKSKRFEALYLTHFGKVTDVKNHLVELEGRLRNWANWIRPYVEQEMPDEELIPLFQAYVAIQMNASGITGENLAKYESANPSWMSVAGLVRYWKKKNEG